MEAIQSVTSGEDVFQFNRRRNWAAFWLLGMINNFHYCLVLSAADDIANSFNLKSYVALVSWANVFFGIVVRLLNAFVYANVPYNRRYLLAGCQTIMGIILVSVSKYLGSNDWFRFFVALIGVVFCGNGSTYGESVSLGYMERFPSTTVGGWSSGTGMSGVLSSLIYLGLTAAGLTNSLIFVVSAPLVLVYWVMYFFVLKVPDDGGNPSSNWASAPWSATQPPSSEGDEGGIPVARKVSDSAASLRTVVDSSSSSSPKIESARLLTTSDDKSVVDSCPRVIAHEDEWWCVSKALAVCSRRTALRLEAWRARNWRTTCEIHAITFPNNINLLIVYVAEYAVQFMAPFSFPCEMVKHSSRFWLKNSFVVTQFCYQIGVLMSRSSLACIRIRRVWILSVVQCLNAVFWFAQAKLLFVADENDEGREESLAFILFGYMVFVGLFGGASYVNVFYNILESNVNEGVAEEAAAFGGEQQHTLSAREKRQLSMNIGALYAIGGISLGSFIDLIFSNTVLTTSC